MHFFYFFHYAHMCGLCSNIRDAFLLLPTRLGGRKTTATDFKGFLDDDEWASDEKKTRHGHFDKISSYLLRIFEYETDTVWKQTTCWWISGGTGEEHAR